MQKIKLSNRLLMLANQVNSAKVVADIGSDHGYLSIYLMQNQLCKTAIASDINEGPLNVGIENIKNTGFEEQIKTKLSDGLREYSSDECDTIIIAGMGGETIASILKDAPWTKDGNHKLILQPMTLPEELRFFLYTNGYKITKEILCKEGKKIYLCICAIGGGEKLQIEHASSCLVSKHLNNDKLKKDYYVDLHKRYKKAQKGILKAQKERELTNQESHILRLIKELETEVIHMKTTVSNVLTLLERIAPYSMGESWDNIGLLVGDEKSVITKVLCALDITDEVIDEAIKIGAGLIVAHHPLIFTTIDKVTTNNLTGRKIIKLIRNDISAICMHTNLDCAWGGVNDCLADKLELLRIEPLGVGENKSLGRVGSLWQSMKLQEFISYVKEKINAGGIRYADGGRDVTRIAVIGGSGSKFIEEALEKEADTILTAEISYDNFQKAKVLGINIIDAGHFPTENIIIPHLTDIIKQNFHEIEAVESKVHEDVVKFI